MGTVRYTLWPNRWLSPTIPDVFRFVWFLPQKHAKTHKQIIIFYLLQDVHGRTCLEHPSAFRPTKNEHPRCRACRNMLTNSKSFQPCLIISLLNMVGPGLRALRVRKLRVDGAKALSPGHAPIYYQKMSYRSDAMGINGIVLGKYTKSYGKIW